MVSRATRETFATSGSLDLLSVITEQTALPSTANYVIDHIWPTLISNDEVVTVSYHSNRPSLTDFIAAYSPADIYTKLTSPVKYGLCANSLFGQDYLQSGFGQLTFNLTNLRASVKFYYLTGSLLEKNIQIVNASEQVVKFRSHNEPLRNRIVPTGDPDRFQLLWSSSDDVHKPVMKWGSVSGWYDRTVRAEKSAIEREEMCGHPANNTGWRDLGGIYTANLIGMTLLPGREIYYVFGDETTGEFSEEKVFHAPPLPGQREVSADGVTYRGTQVVLMGDLGVGSSDSSADTTVWMEPCPPAINTSMSIGHRVSMGEVDAVLLTGDISYSDGYMASWDFFLDMISPFAGSVHVYRRSNRALFVMKDPFTSSLIGGALFLSTVGNHDGGYPGVGFNRDYGLASGGECGVPAFRLLPMPRPATLYAPW